MEGWALRGFDPTGTFKGILRKGHQTANGLQEPGAGLCFSSGLGTVDLVTPETGTGSCPTSTDKAACVLLFCTALSDRHNQSNPRHLNPGSKCLHAIIWWIHRLMAQQKIASLKSWEFRGVRWALNLWQQAEWVESSTFCHPVCEWKSHVYVCRDSKHPMSAGGLVRGAWGGDGWHPQGDRKSFTIYIIEVIAENSAGITNWSKIKRLRGPGRNLGPLGAGAGAWVLRGFPLQWGASMISA